MCVLRSEYVSFRAIHVCTHTHGISRQCLSGQLVITSARCVGQSMPKQQKFAIWPYVFSLFLPPSGLFYCHNSFCHFLLPQPQKFTNHIAFLNGINGEDLLLRVWIKYSFLTPTCVNVFLFFSLYLREHNHIYFQYCM